MTSDRVYTFSNYSTANEFLKESENRIKVIKIFYASGHDNNIMIHFKLLKEK